MKIIFLDIDGVLNHELWLQSPESKAEVPGNSHARWFDPRAVALLNNLTDATYAKIVVSSSWRLDTSLDDLRVLLQKQGITGEIIGKTPYLSYASDEGTYLVPRGCEIQAWLENNRDKVGFKLSKASYVILDDQSDMLLWQQRNFFRVDPCCGLTKTIVEKATDFLM